MTGNLPRRRGVMIRRGNSPQRQWGRLVAVLAFGTACHGVPHAAPETSTKRERPWPFAVASYGCGSWSPEIPDTARVTADLFYSGSVDSTVAAISVAGGRVMHIWNIPAVRAEIDPLKIAELARAPHYHISSANVVTPDSPLDASLLVLVSDSLEKFDFAALARLKVRVTARFYHVRGFAASAPDSVIPVLRRMNGVATLGHSDFVCAG